MVLRFKISVLFTHRRVCYLGQHGVEGGDWPKGSCRFCVYRHFHDCPDNALPTTQSACGLEIASCRCRSRPTTLELRAQPLPLLHRVAPRRHETRAALWPPVAHLYGRSPYPKSRTDRATGATKIGD